MNSQNTGNPIADMIFLIGLTLFSWSFALLDHFFVIMIPNLEMVDVIMGYCVKILALVASGITVKVGLSKLQESKKSKKDAKGK